MKCPICRSKDAEAARGFRMFRKFTCRNCRTTWTPKGDGLASLVVGLGFLISAFFMGNGEAGFSPEQLTGLGLGVGITSGSIAVLVRKPKKGE